MALVCSILTLNIAGSDFEGSDKLVVMANSAPPCATSIYSEILKIPSGKALGVKPRHSLPFFSSLNKDKYVLL